RHRVVRRAAHHPRRRHLRLPAQTPEMAGAKEMTSRRCFLAAASLAVVGSVAGLARLRDRKKALVAVSFDLEMSRNFPTWEQTHWDYEKGNLNPEAKKYTVDAARLLKENGGVLHCFSVGRTLEQES